MRLRGKLSAIKDVDSKKYSEAQRAVIYTIIKEAANGDIKTIRALTDSMGFKDTWFDNFHYKKAFSAAQDEFIQSQQDRGHVYSLDNILGKIEEGYRTNGFAIEATSYMGFWRTRVEESMNLLLGNPITAAKLLQDHSIRSEAIEIIDGASERVRTARQPSSEIALMAYQLQGIAQKGGTQVFTYREELLRASQMQPTSSGYDFIDDRLLYNRFSGTGGFAPSMLTSILLPSENGKTSLAMAFAVKWIERGLPCLILSAEEARHNLSVRITNAYTGIPADKIVEYIRLQADYPGEERNEEIEGALELIQKYFLAYEISGDTAEMENIVRRHRVQFGEDLPMLVMVDHIGAMDQGEGNWSRGLEQVMKFLKIKIADQFRVAVNVFSQVPAAMEAEYKEKNYTTLKEARGSRGIRQWSDYMIGGSRHNGVPMPSTPADAFFTATVLQSLKNRFQDSRRGRINWGVYNFDTSKGIIDYLITDDWQEQFSISGDQGDVI